MQDIEALLPSHGPADSEALRRLDADVLARYAADPARMWWRRRNCASALTGRVPEQLVTALTDRIKDPDETTEVRIALLELLAPRGDLLSWLCHPDREREHSFGWHEAVLEARGLAGDRSAVAELAALAFSDWPHLRRMGDAGLDALTERYGVEAVLAELGDTRPEDRAVRLRRRYQADENVTDGLADPDHSVAYLAQSLICEAQLLREYLGVAPTVEATLWAAFALHRLTEDAHETRRIYDTLGRPRVEVPGLDEQIRHAIVHKYAPRCQRRSDPRWRIEHICTEPPALPDVQDQLHRVASALTAAGFEPRNAVSCGDYYRQGGGTYFVLPYGDRELYVSTLGPFAWGDEDDPAARSCVESVGLRWIDKATRSIEVTDLHVYYFGDREPLGIGTLLFYWQD